MAEIDTQALNKKLAEWAFPDKIVRIYSVAIEIWGGRLEQHHDELITIINPFTDSLDACFKWLVPKARTKFGVTEIDFSYIADEVGCRLFGGYGALLQLSRGNLSKTEATTLCLAIERLINETSS